jgi:hypothetical protein
MVSPYQMAGMFGRLSNSCSIFPGFLSALKGGEEPGRATGVSGPW